jgi:hypothetical protein
VIESNGWGRVDKGEKGGRTEGGGKRQSAERGEQQREREVEGEDMVSGIHVRGGILG